MKAKFMARFAVCSVFAGIVSLGALSACTSDSGPAPSSSGSSSGAVAAGPVKNIEISTFAFQPEALSVSVGTTVTWTNHDNIRHTVTSGTPDKPGGPLSGNLDGSGTTYSYKFDAAGEYPYFCDVHHGMTGKVTVTP